MIGGAKKCLIKAASPSFRVVNLLGDLIDFPLGWLHQHQHLKSRLETKRSGRAADVFDEVILLEHNPVYTLGRGSDEENIVFLQGGGKHEVDCLERLSRDCWGEQLARLTLPDHLILMSEAMQKAWSDEKMSNSVVAPNGASIFRVERGGDVTFHGPGQLVVYVSFDLERSPFRRDLHLFLRLLEDVIIQTLAAFDIEGKRDPTNTGVWVGEDKIAAIGISSSRWLTTHGFSLNVSPDLAFFDTSMIIPCGIRDKGVTCMSSILAPNHRHLDVEMVAQVVVDKIESVYHIERL